MFPAKASAELLYTLSWIAPLIPGVVTIDSGWVLNSRGGSIRIPTSRGISSPLMMRFALMVFCFCSMFGTSISGLTTNRLLSSRDSPWLTVKDC